MGSVSSQVKNKVVSLTEAMKLIKKKNLIGIGGMTIYRRPVGLITEIIRQKISELAVLGFCLGFETDLLLARGLVKQIRTCMYSLETFGMSPLFRKAIEANEVDLIEETEHTIAQGLIPKGDIPYLESIGVSGNYTAGAPLAEIVEHIRERALRRKKKKTAI